MPKTILTEENIKDIIRLYQTEVSSTHKLGEIFKVGHKKISQILKDGNIEINSKGGQDRGITKVVDSAKTIVYESLDADKKYVAVCKMTGKIFDDPNNYSGTLTEHILKTYGDVPIPTNTYQRKKYELSYGKKWFEEYFDINEIVKNKIRYCELCDWTTEDVENKTGCFEHHLIKVHNKNLTDYLNEYPEDLIYHHTHILELEREEILMDETESVLCLECKKRFLGITNTHMKKHNMSIVDYKNKWGWNVKILCENTNEYLSQQVIEMNKNSVPKFTSGPQLELKEFIESLGLVVVNNNKSVLSGTEIDLYIPEKNIGIEYNGLYWHSEKMGKHRNYHINKTIMCDNNNIKLIQIFEDEWRDKKDIVKSRLKHILKSNNSKIYARKCKVKVISTKIKNEYLTKTHLQGPDASNIKLGAYYNNELVGVMTFSSGRKALGGKAIIDNYELVRFATNGVVGLASKMLQYFIKNYNPKIIISYADRRWSTGDLYEKIGFSSIGETKPNYWYTKDFRKREHRFNYRKDILVSKGYDKNKTESEIMVDLGYNKIWDCGSLKYELKL